MAQVVDALDLAAHRVILMDTLEIDGASPSDTAISAWPADLYERGSKLSGILYFHRIPDPNMSEILTSRKESGAFRKLCGDSAPLGVNTPTDSKLGNEREVKSKNFFEAILGRGYPSDCRWRGAEQGAQRPNRGTNRNGDDTEQAVEDKDEQLAKELEVGIQWRSKSFRPTAGGWHPTTNDRSTRSGTLSVLMAHLQRRRQLDYAKKTISGTHHFHDIKMWGSCFLSWTLAYLALCIYPCNET
ncbi:hypothetical protein BJ322DRAFT_1019243 [Thelephora terrestris]|uniref:Uncharacterized protein n=1 Tax=Thelephora terrestris TaxID=56493 RepID=A0A9P6HKL2_9AGAM|nr:hypothetical protein BJ322DRAFT_1019243 [Thelephora terrestris]